jgi:tetrahydromethanopterin S-methyltransferase subunit G
MHAHPLEARLAHVEGAFDRVNERLSSLDRRLDSFAHTVALRFDEIDRRFEGCFGQTDSRFAQLDGRFAQIDTRFNWLIGIVIGTWITTILTILFHH